MGTAREVFLMWEKGCWRKLIGRFLSGFLDKGVEDGFNWVCTLMAQMTTVQSLMWEELTGVREVGCILMYYRWFQCH